MSEVVTPIHNQTLDMPTQAERTPVIPAQVPPAEPVAKVRPKHPPLVSNPILVNAVLPHINAGLTSEQAIEKAFNDLKNGKPVALAGDSTEVLPERQEEPTDEEREAYIAQAKYRYLLACARRITGKISGLSRQELYEVVCTSTEDFASFDTWMGRVED